MTLMRTGWACALPVLALAMQLGSLACISDLIVLSSRTKVRYSLDH